MSMPEGNADVFRVGRNAREEARFPGVPFELQKDQALVRLERPVSQEEARAAIAETFNLPVGDVEAVPEKSAYEPEKYHRWIVHLAADDFDGNRQQIFKVNTGSEFEFVRPIYMAGNDPTTASYPIFSSLVVNAADFSPVDETLRDMEFRVTDNWSRLFAAVSQRFHNNDHPMLRRSRETDSSLYRHYQLPENVISSLDTDFFRSLGNVVRDDNVSSIDFDWAPVRPYTRVAGRSRASRQWNLDDIFAREAWQRVPRDRNIPVAILDSGFDLGHADLATAFLEPGFHFNAKQFLDGLAHPELSTGVSTYDARHTTDAHGTAVAGIVAAIQNNDRGVDGVAAGCKIMPVRLGVEPSSLKLVVGLAWAAYRGARVVNMSFELAAPLSVAVEMVDAAHELGMVMVAASGNNGEPHENPNPPVPFPASHPKVIAVGAIDRDRKRVVPGGPVTWGSQFRGGVDVVAPGIDVLTTDVSGAAGGYVGDYIDPGGEGTSAAAPQVAALAGMILAVNPALDAETVGNIIRETATRLDAHKPDANGFNDEVGYGLINCFEAVKRAKREAPVPDGRGEADVSQWAQLNAMDFLSEFLQDVRSGRSGFRTITEDARSLRPLVCLTGTVLVPRDQVNEAVTDDAREQRNREKAEAEEAGEARPIDTWYRLYLNNDLSEWVDFDHDALRHLRTWGFDSSPLGRVSVWLDAGARLGHSVSTSAGGFLAGQLLRSAQATSQQAQEPHFNPTLEQILSTMSRDGTYSTLARNC